MEKNIRVLGGNTQLVSMREAAARLNVPLSTFQKHYREWGVPARKVGRSVKFMERELLAWIEAQPRVSGS
jgi:excisionase family DNA binding protein